MAVIKVHKTKGYTVMSNTHLREREMSLKAKGLLSLMFSLPEDWDYSIAGLVTLSKDGKDAVMAALKELERFGYLVRTRTTDGAGRFTGYDYDIYEQPNKPVPDEGFPEEGKPYAENPNTENPPQLSKDLPTTEVPITEKPKDERDRKDRKDKSREAQGLPEPSLASLGITDREYSMFDGMRDREAIEKAVYLKPTALTKMLVSGGYLAKDDPYTSDYNLFLGTLKDQYGFENVRDCISYFLAKTKGDRAKIEDRRAYFKASMLSGLANYTRDWNKVYELAGGK